MEIDTKGKVWNGKSWMENQERKNVQRKNHAYRFSEPQFQVKILSQNFESKFRVKIPSQNSESKFPARMDWIRDFVQQSMKG